MRKLMLATLIAALIAVALTSVAPTSEAAPRGRRQAGAARPVYASKDTPATTKALAIQLAMERKKAARYRGLSVKADPNAEGEELAVQERIADQLSRLDYVPAHRVEHFRWIPEELGLTIYGWRGRIISAVPAPNGVTVTMRVAPIVPIGTGAHTLESYFYSKGRLVHLASQAGSFHGVTTY